jgi:Armadillo/beta-catenin-like repeat
VNAISDAVTSISRMSRLQALFQAEDIRDGLKAAAADLRAAVATLAPMQSFLPPDAKEDFNALERQLASLKLGTRPTGILAAQSLLKALTLDQEEAILKNSADTTATAADPSISSDRATSTTNSTYCVEYALQIALFQAGLASLPAETWLDNELAALSCGILDINNARAVGNGSSDLITIIDPIDAFHLGCAAIALLKAAVLDRLYRNQEEENGVNYSEEEEEEEEVDIEDENEAWAEMVAENIKIERSCTLIHVLASTFHLTRKTRVSLETALQAVGEFTNTDEEKLKLENCSGLCAALASAATKDNNENVALEEEEEEEEEELCGSPVALSNSVLLRQYKAAVLISYAAEEPHLHSHGNNDSGGGSSNYTLQNLLAAGVIPALLTILETSHHVAIRTAAATAIRTLCRDPVAREAAAAAGCLRPLARLLQSQRAGPRRAAARAFGNVIVAGEQYKREAVEKYSIHGSLIAMLRSDDALGQEAAALALANLAANSELVQAALGKTDVFNPLSEILHHSPSLANSTTTTTTSYATISSSTCTASSSATAAVAQHAAARAVRNLTSRVQFNRLKASAAGAVPGLVALLQSPDAAGRAVAASALATVMDGCSDAVSQAVSAGATTELLKILQEDSSLACRDAAACAVVHIVQANALQQQHSNSSTSTTTNTTTTTAGTAGTATVPRDFELISVGINTSALPALISLLSNGTPSGRHAAARLLVFLAKYKSKDVVVAAGAVTHLVPLLSAKHDSVRRQATTACCVLMHRCDAARLQFLEARGMPLLVALLRPPLPQLQKNNDEGGEEKKQQQPIASSVVGINIPVGEVEEGTRQEAARALSILCANNKFSQGAIATAAGAIEALVNIIKQGKIGINKNKINTFIEPSSSSSSSSSPTSPFASPSSLATQEAAVVALSNLACLPSNQAALAEAGAGQALLRLLHHDAPSGCRVAAARGLSNMVADGVPGELQRAVSDMVQLLAQLAMSSDEGNEDKILGSDRSNSHHHHHHHHNEHEHQIAAACALGNLSCADAHGADAVARYGGAAVLAQLCRSEIPSVREAAVQGLWESCRGSGQARHVAAVQQQVVPWLVQILIVGEDPSKEAAAGCLAELTRCGEIVCAAAEEAGALLLLKQLADHGSVDVAGAAAAALKALQRRSPDSPSLEHELSQRLSSLRELGSRRFDSGGEEEEGELEEEEAAENVGNEQ